jgi:hypothetical protein
MKAVKTLTLLTICVTSIALAEDFKTVNGKEVQERDDNPRRTGWVVLKHKSGVSKVYFPDLPKEVQERFHYDSAKAARIDAASARISRRLMRTSKK